MPRISRPDMDGYGVPEDLDGALDWQWAEERLADSRNFWLVTADGAGRPHAMPVWGAWIPERETFGFSCEPSARKVRNIAANDRVVVTADSTVEVVSIEGRATLAEGEALDAVATAWAEKYQSEPGLGPVDEIKAWFLAEATAYEVIPERGFGMIETPEEFGPCATKWTWD